MDLPLPLRWFLRFMFAFVCTMIAVVLFGSENISSEIGVIMFMSYFIMASLLDDVLREAKID